MEATKPTSKRYIHLRSTRDGGVTVWHCVRRSQGWDSGLAKRNLYDIIGYMCSTDAGTATPPAAEAIPGAIVATELTPGGGIDGF
ncbi:uncharacterized protein DS421_16g544250 [Arachis hypogaea]|nr:uncharacterized protein DS421_16g544250 [Arachis hypogaea]